MKYIYVGRINGTHGLKGELKLKSDFLYKEKILTKDFNFYIGKDKKHVLFKKSRNHNGIDLITFQDFEDINLVENLKNNNLYINKEDLILKEDEYVFEDYIGLDCYTKEKYLGKVTDIVDCGHKNYIIDIIGNKEILIPLNKQFIEKVIPNDKIIFKEVEDLIDAN